MESQRLCKKTVRHGTHLPKCHVCKWPVMCKRGLRPLPFRIHQYSEGGILQSPHQEIVMHMWKQALLPSPADVHRHPPAWDVQAPRIQIARLAICLSPLLSAHVSHVGGIFQISSCLRTGVGWGWVEGAFPSGPQPRCFHYSLCRGSNIPGAILLGKPQLQGLCWVTPAPTLGVRVFSLCASFSVMVYFRCVSVCCLNRSCFGGMYHVNTQKALSVCRARKNVAGFLGFYKCVCVDGRSGGGGVDGSGN